MGKNFAKYISELFNKPLERIQLEVTCDLWMVKNENCDDPFFKMDIYSGRITSEMTGKYIAEITKYLCEKYNTSPERVFIFFHTVEHAMVGNEGLTLKALFEKNAGT